MRVTSELVSVAAEERTKIWLNPSCLVAVIVVPGGMPGAETDSPATKF